MSFAWKGGCRAHISQRTQPTDQISLFMSQGRSCHTSGDAQQGVPVCVLSIPFATLDTLRSPSFRMPSLVKNKFALLMSLCTIFSSCRAWRPLRSWTRYDQHSASGMQVRYCLHWVMRCKRSPPSANSITILSVCVESSINDSLYKIMFSFLQKAINKSGRIILLYRCQNADFIECILFFFFVQLWQFDLQNIKS